MNLPDSRRNANVGSDKSDTSCRDWYDVAGSLRYLSPMTTHVPVILPWGQLS